MFNVGLQKYFDKKIKTVINNSAEVAKNYVDQTRNSIEADISLMVLDFNNLSDLFYANPQRFSTLLGTQRLLRRLDEVHILDSTGNIIMSNVVNINMSFVQRGNNKSSTISGAKDDHPIFFLEAFESFLNSFDVFRKLI